MKVCSKCSSEGPFFKKHSECKTCTAAALQKWRKEHPERTAKQRRRNRIKMRYGINTSEWESLFESQGRCCAICKTKNPRGRGWHVDHDHLTGINRSILCTFCNPGLGMFKDSPELLRAAADYLEFWRKLESNSITGMVAKTQTGQELHS